MIKKENEMPLSLWIKEDDKDTQFGKCWQGICLTQIVKTVLNKQDANKIRSFFDSHTAIIKDIIFNIKDQTKLDGILGLVYPTLKNNIYKIQINYDNPKEIQDRLYNCLKLEILKERNIVRKGAGQIL